jgi:hypothetical protein
MPHLSTTSVPTTTPAVVRTREARRPGRAALAATATALAMLAVGVPPAAAEPGRTGKAPRSDTGPASERRDPPTPLADYTPLTRRTPTPAQNFSYLTTTHYWSVVAIRPPAGSDYDLRLFDDAAQTVQLAQSSFGGSVVDFIAVDTNRRPLGDYLPRAYFFAGPGGPYQIELAQGAMVLNAGSSTVTMAAGNVVAVRDAYLTAGTPVTLSVAPTTLNQDPELFLLGDDTNPASWVRTRSSAVATASAAGPGTVEQLAYTPTVTGWYGVAVVNKAGTGTYTLTRS